METRLRDIQSWEQVIVQRIEVGRVHSDGHRNVWLQPRLQAELPASRPTERGQAPTDDDRGGELVVDRQEVGSGVHTDGSPEFLDGAHRVVDDLAV